jgi:hypothetical protein
MLLQIVHSPFIIFPRSRHPCAVVFLAGKFEGKFLAKNDHAGMPRSGEGYKRRTKNLQIKGAGMRAFLPVPLVTPLGTLYVIHRPFA